eukprot:g3885.t1
MLVFGERDWTRRGEPFSVYFRMIGMIAPLQITPPETGIWATVRISWPGQRCVSEEPPSIGAAVFLLLTLGTASFDGFAETFTWLATIGVNPLEFPGRSAVTLPNTLGLLAAPAVLALVYFTAVLAGAGAIKGRGGRSGISVAAHLVYSIVPISVAFHGAHYLSMLLINGQYLLAAISDPFDQGWNLFGTAHWHVTASMLIDIHNVQQLWIAQTIIIAGGHCIGILIAHMIALRRFDIPARATASQILLAAVMVGYTVFGLWLLPASFRFRSGEFVMIGLPNAAKPVFRAYSVASPSWDEEIEFFSIKVQNGPLTEHLQKVKPGDTVLMRKKPTGTLVLDALLPGKRLYMLSTGTGVAPFASLIRDPETYDKFDEVVLIQTCREVEELTYITRLVEGLMEDPLVGEMVKDRLRLFTTTTRESFPRMGRITDLMASGSFFEQMGLPPISAAEDRAMICGSMAMIKDTSTMLEGFGLVEGANNNPATFVVERAFVG